LGGIASLALSRDLVSLMPALTNPKHERFAQELAKGKTADEAYVVAGYKENRHNASRMKTNETILGRVSQLQNVASQRVEVTLASLMEEAGEIQAAAMEAKQLSAATAALTIKAKLAGLWVDKAENTNRNVDPAQVTDAELAAVVQADGSTGTATAPVNPSQLN
jgi:phage terminase small subunit